MTNLCRVCDCELKDEDKKFFKSLGTKCYFDVNCSACGVQYACDETGSVVRFIFSREQIRTLSPSAESATA